ncbi:MAG TPA: hypothetical protein VIT22_06445 [Pseudoxanthomonas sp.]
MRTRAQDGTYFFTVNLAERHGNIILSPCSPLWRGRNTCTAFGNCRQTMTHSQCVWRPIKSRFSRSLPKDERRSQSRVCKSKRGIWRRRYWERLVRSEAHFQRCLDYIHYNPIKHGHAAHALDWPHSSFRHWAERGVCPMDWATAPKAGLPQSNEMLD